MSGATRLEKLHAQQAALLPAAGAGGKRPLQRQGGSRKRGGSASPGDGGDGGGSSDEEESEANKAAKVPASNPESLIVQRILTRACRVGWSSLTGSHCCTAAELVVCPVVGLPGCNFADSSQCGAGHHSMPFAYSMKPLE